jgi:hypothetical protein
MQFGTASEGSPTPSPSPPYHGAAARRDYRLRRHHRLRRIPTALRWTVEGSQQTGLPVYCLPLWGGG